MNDYANKHLDRRSKTCDIRSKKEKSHDWCFRGDDTFQPPPSSPGVPTAEEVVAMAGELAVVIEGELEFAAGLGEGEDLLTGNGVPDFQRGIVADAEEPLTIGTEAATEHPIGVREGRTDQLTRVCMANVNFLIRSTSRE